MKKLQDFTNRVGESVFSSDHTFRSFMKFFLNETENSRVDKSMKEWEKNIPYWNALADESVRFENQPRLERFDRVGNKVEKIVVSLETRLLRHRVVEAGVFKNAS